MKFVNKARRESSLVPTSSLIKITNKTKASSNLFNKFLKKFKNIERSSSQNEEKLWRNLSEVWFKRDKFTNFKPIRQTSEAKMSSSARFKLKIDPISTQYSTGEETCLSEINFWKTSPLIINLDWGNKGELVANNSDLSLISKPHCKIYY